MHTPRRFRDLIAMKSQHTLGIHFAILDRLREEEQKVPEYQDPEYLHVLARLRQQSDERLFYVAREYTRVLVRWRFPRRLSLTKCALTADLGFANVSARTERA